MMKKFAREMTLICLPLTIVGGGFGVWRLLHPSLDPNACIELTIKRKQPMNIGQNSVFLSWEANASNGPSHEFLPVYNQAIWAVGDNWKKQIFAEPTLPGISAPQIITGGAGWSPLGWNSVQRLMETQEIEIPIEVLPRGTRKLEWKGHFVAAPTDDKNRNWPAANAARSRQIARLPGAVSKTYSFTVALDTAK